MHGCILSFFTVPLLSDEVPQSPADDEAFPAQLPMTTYPPQPKENEVGVNKLQEQQGAYAQAPPAYQPNAFPQG